MIPLSAGTRARLDVLFPPEARAEATRLLEERCAESLHLPEQASELLERIRFAALKLSDGRLDALHEAVRLAGTDWRDLLVAAGFAESTTAHLRWVVEPS